jgi:hypothetical protein
VSTKGLPRHSRDEPASKRNAPAVPGGRERNLPETRYETPCYHEDFVHVLPTRTGVLFTGYKNDFSENVAAIHRVDGFGGFGQRPTVADMGFDFSFADPGEQVFQVSGV